MDPVIIAQLVIMGISALEPVVAALIAQLEMQGASTDAHTNLLVQLGATKSAAQATIGS